MPASSRKCDSLRLWSPLLLIPNPLFPAQVSRTLRTFSFEWFHPDVTLICAFLTLILFLPLCPCQLSTFVEMNAQIYTSLSQTSRSRTSCPLLLCGNPALCSDSAWCALCTSCHLWRHVYRWGRQLCRFCPCPTRLHPEPASTQQFRTFYDHSPITSRSRSTDEKQARKLDRFNLSLRNLLGDAIASKKDEFTLGIGFGIVVEWKPMTSEGGSDFTKDLKITPDFFVTLSRVRGWEWEELNRVFYDFDSNINGGECSSECFRITLQMTNLVELLYDDDDEDEWGIHYEAACRCIDVDSSQALMRSRPSARKQWSWWGGWSWRWGWGWSSNHSTIIIGLMCSWCPNYWEVLLTYLMWLWMNIFAVRLNELLNE